MTPASEKMLQDLFGDYRAEWRSDLFGKLFIRPPYFADLESRRPCLLFGGRGSGKTTALRSLRFDATRIRIAQQHPAQPAEYLGVFIRTNKNRVRAFDGPGQDEATWDRAFAHYFNLLFALEGARLLLWLEAEEKWAPFTARELAPFAKSLGIPEPQRANDLEPLLTDAVITLELFANNPVNAARPLFSMAEAPLRLFASLVSGRAEGRGRILYCCIDEYENLSERQQSVLNTYIKHSEPPLSYKIGVRRHGLKTRNTIDKQDLLRYPDDYAEIDISSDLATSFSVEVVEQRLRLAATQDADVPSKIEALLPGLSRTDEAELLGAPSAAQEVVEVLSRDAPDLINWVKELGVDAYFLSYCAEMDREPLAKVARFLQADQSALRNRLNNYGYVSLFWLSKGRKGARIRKYYCGSDVFLALASGNIRYLLELIDEGISHQLRSEKPSRGTFRILPLAQTLAAKEVGRRRLDQLEGVSARGIELKRLVLAIGKVFFEFARNPVGHTPEVASFVLSGAPDSQAKVAALLSRGVAHLAFEVAPRTKATSPKEMRDDEYYLHPIFAPFFEYTYRRKRRAVFPAEALEAVQTQPRTAIDRLMEGRRQAASDELPEQLAMFERFFSGDAHAG